VGFVVCSHPSNIHLLSSDAAPVNNFPLDATAIGFDPQWVFDLESKQWAVGDQHPLRDPTHLSLAAVLD
jgi:hypothetical protein